MAKTDAVSVNQDSSAVPTEEQHEFSADVSRILDIVTRSLYANRDVFLRELVSNAADACDRLRYDLIAAPDLVPRGYTPSIRIMASTETRTLSVSDNGIGMDRQDLIDNLGIIARSGTAALKAAIGNGQEAPSLIGQFGVGFYSAFMMANQTDVISRKAGTLQTWHWSSDGHSGFSVRPATESEAALLPGSSGTLIILHIRDEASDYLIEDKIKDVIRRYSDHITVPVYIGGATEPANAARALWMRSAKEVTSDQYAEFYRHISHGFDDPAMTSHWRAEGVIEYNALLFIPTLRPWDLFDPQRKNSVRLYVRRVLITEDCEDLVYPWLRFLRGVIDSEDLPLNVSREMLQHNPVISKIRTGIARRVLSDMAGLATKDPDAFLTIWGQFGPVIKEGLYDAPEHRDDLLKICRFSTTSGNGNQMTSLEEYVSRMKNGQTDIYYLSGENRDSLLKSPYLEGFRARGLEVLILTDTIDDFWLQMVPDYKGKTFRSITKGELDLSAFHNDNSDSDAGNRGDFSASDTEEKKQTTYNPNLISFFEKQLADEIGRAVYSSRLTNSPACLIAGEQGTDLKMERILKIHQKYDPKTKRTLELNPAHPLIIKLSDLLDKNPHSPALAEAAQVLYEQARITLGEPVKDPAAYARSVSNFMLNGLSG